MVYGDNELMTVTHLFQACNTAKATVRTDPAQPPNTAVTAVTAAAPVPAATVPSLSTFLTTRRPGWEGGTSPQSREAQRCSAA